MASTNIVVLIGNACRDPELRYVNNGTAVADISMAVNDRVKRGDEWVDEATFVDVVFWGRTAEVAGEYLKKGAQFSIVGRLKLDTWEKDGQKRSKLKIVAEKLQLLGGRQRDEATQDHPPYTPDTPPAEQWQKPNTDQQSPEYQNSIPF